MRSDLITVINEIINHVKIKFMKKPISKNITGRLKSVYGFTGDKQIADLFNISPQSFVNKRKTGSLLSDIINAGVNKNVNLNWLLTGEGDPYINKVMEEGFPTGSGESIYKDRGGLAQEAPEVYNVDQGFKVSEALTMAARVLDSGTSYAFALYTNIRHFDRAIQAEARITDLEDKNKDQADRVLKLENECEDLRKRLAALEESIKKPILNNKDTEEGVQEAVNQK